MASVQIIAARQQTAMESIAASLGRPFKSGEHVLGPSGTAHVLEALASHLDPTFERYTTDTPSQMVERPTVPAAEIPTEPAEA